MHDTIITDNGWSGLSVVEEGSTKAVISRKDFAAILYVFATVTSNVKVCIHGVDMYLRLQQDFIATDRAAVYKGDLTTILEERGKQSWCSVAESLAFDSSRNSNNRITPSLTVHAYRSASCGSDSYNSSFKFQLNRSGQAYFINTSCAPTQLITGRNDLPLATPKEPKAKAKFIVGMFLTPFYALAQVLNKHGYANNLKEAADKRDVAFTKNQFAAYSPKFKSEVERNTAIACLHHVYSAKIPRVVGKGAHVGNALNIRVNDSEAEYDFKRSGSYRWVSGFLLDCKYSNYPSFSLGLYAKDWVVKSSNEARNLKTKVAAGTKVRIRMDLNIHSEGYKLLSRQLHSLSGGKIDKMDKTTAKDVEKFLSQLFEYDESFGIVFKLVLTHSLRFDQMFGVSSKQWQKAFDILKKEGLSELADVIRDGQISQQDKSWQKLALKHGINNPSRFCQKIEEATRTKFTDKRTGETVYTSGVDLKFPYKVHQLVREEMVRLYSDPDAVSAFIETGRFPNSYDFDAVRKEASEMARSIYTHMMNGQLSKVPTQQKESAK